jgi:rhodanese-related sulfurtransferase
MRRRGLTCAAAVLAAALLAAALLAAAAGCGPAPKEASAKLEKIDELYAAARFFTFAQVPEATVEELMSARERGERVALVDVREAEEWEVSMIPGAVTREQFEKDLEKHRDARIVVYCTIGGRAGIYAADLRGRGFRAEVLKGSILTWTHAGGPLVEPGGRPTRRVHTCKEAFNLAADGYEPTW